MSYTINSMTTLEVFHLTHPEVLSDPELREILENCCIDFSNYKHLSRSQLIELYKRVAMPLPKRKTENSQNSNIKKDNEQEKQNSSNEYQGDVTSLNSKSNVERDVKEMKTSPSSCSTKPKCSANEIKQISKKIHLYNSNNVKDCNGVDKRVNLEKHDEAPSRKRQKITWP